MANTLLIRGGRVIDGTGAPTRADEDVLVSDGRIAGLGAEAARRAAELTANDPNAVDIIDATGKSILPGLVDAHTHLTFGEPTGNDELFHHRTEAYSSMLAAHQAQKVLRAGVTSVLDADCLWNIAVELRDAIDAGFVVGPRMAAGGNALMTSVGGTAGRMIRDEGRTGYASVVHNQDGMVQEVRRQIKYGVDWIKVHVTGIVPSIKGPEVKVWSFPELQAVCDAAHEVGIPVVGHCRNSLSTLESAQAGMDLIYHSSYMDHDALAAVVENGSMLCPTFTLLGNLADYGEKIGTDPGLLAMFRAEIESTGKIIHEAHRAGVPVLTGSETGFAVTPIGEWHARELELLVEYAGFTPLEAIRAATQMGARAMKLSGETGTVQTGMAADLIVIDGDPARDVRVLQDRSRLSEVILRGHRVDITTPLPERTVRPEEKVRFLAACPLTQALALPDTGLSDTDMDRLSRA